MAQRKRPFTIKRLYDLANETISFTAFDLDDKPIPEMRARFEAKKCAPTNRHYAMLFGFNQTICDTAALPQGSSLSDKFAAIRDRIEHLESGSNDWSGSSREPGEGTLLHEALMRQKPNRDAMKTAKWVAALKPAQKTAMLASEELRDIVAEIRAERGKGVEVEGLFRELEEMES